MTFKNVWVYMIMHYLGTKCSYIYIYILNQEKKGRACSFLSFSFCCYPNEYLTRIL